MKNIKKVIVVDDEPQIRNIFCRQLKEEGVYALEAGDCGKALSMINRAKDIGLVVLDIRLRELSGLDFYDTLRKEFPNLKILVSSAIPKEEQKFLIGSADDYYYKSEELTELSEKVRRLLGLSSVSFSRNS